MKNVQSLSENYFLKFRESPVKIRPYNPKSKTAAEEYIKFLHQIIGEEILIRHRGSTAYGIAGKKEIEVGIYPTEAEWQNVIAKIKNKLVEPGNSEEDYVRFNDTFEEFPVEIILLKGEVARIDLAKTDYLLNHPELLKQYEDIKMKYSYSKREYERQKAKFLDQVTEMIPD